jgi:hypothetical protein
MTEQKKSAGAIFKLIPEIMKEMDAVPKSRRMQQGASYAFRGIEDIYNHLQKLLAQKQVFASPEIISQEMTATTKDKINHRGEKTGGTQTSYHLVVHYRFHFYAHDGSSFTADAIGEGIDYGDKAAGKCASGAHKNALIQVFMIPTESQDHTPEAPPAPLPKPAPKATPKKVAPKPAPTPAPTKQEKLPDPPPPSGPPIPATQGKGEVTHLERIQLWQDAQMKGWNMDEFVGYLKKTYDVESTAKLNREKFDLLSTTMRGAERAVVLEEMNSTKKENMNECK